MEEEILEHNAAKEQIFSFEDLQLFFNETRQMQRSLQTALFVDAAQAVIDANTVVTKGDRTVRSPIVVAWLEQLLRGAYGELPEFVDRLTVGIERGCAEIAKVRRLSKAESKLSILTCLAESTEFTANTPNSLAPRNREIMKAEVVSALATWPKNGNVSVLATCDGATKALGIWAAAVAWARALEALRVKIKNEEG